MWLRTVKLFDSSVYCGRINWASIKKFVEELNGAGLVGGISGYEWKDISLADYSAVGMVISGIHCEGETVYGGIHYDGETMYGDIFVLDTEVGRQIKSRFGWDSDVRDVSRELVLSATGHDEGGIIHVEDMRLHVLDSRYRGVFGG